jgi:hypothetical protein
MIRAQQALHSRLTHNRRIVKADANNVSAGRKLPKSAE